MIFTPRSISFSNGEYHACNMQDAQAYCASACQMMLCCIMHFSYQFRRNKKALSRGLDVQLKDPH